MLKRIAVYDYPPNLLKLFQRVLSKKGYEVRVLQGELQHPEELSEFQPNLIILGYIVGYVQNELEVIQWLREHPCTASTPIIICTTGMKQVLEQPETNADGVMLVPKPFSIDQLFSAVDQMLHRREARQLRAVVQY